MCTARWRLTSCGGANKPYSHFKFEFFFLTKREVPIGRKCPIQTYHSPVISSAWKTWRVVWRVRTVVFGPLLDGKPYSFGLAFFSHMYCLPVPFHVGQCNLFRLPRVFELVPRSRVRKKIVLEHRRLGAVMPNAFPCALCGRLHDTQRGLVQHQRRHCTGAVPVLTCAKCGVACDSRRSLAKHQMHCRNRAGHEGATQHDHGDVGYDDEGVDNGEVGRVDSRPSIDAYMSQLDQQGTLDSAFIVRHRAPRRSISNEERAVIRFLRATETGGGCSRRQVESLLQHARTLGPKGMLLPRGYNKLWQIVESAHERIIEPLRMVEIKIPIPVAVQKLLVRPLQFLVFRHVDPVSALLRLLIAGPLAKDPRNLSFRPRPGGTYYDDFCDGERMARYCMPLCVLYITDHHTEPRLACTWLHTPLTCPCVVYSLQDLRCTSARHACIDLVVVF